MLSPSPGKDRRRGARQLWSWLSTAAPGPRPRSERCPRPLLCFLCVSGAMKTSPPRTSARREHPSLGSMVSCVGCYADPQKRLLSLLPRL